MGNCTNRKGPNATSIACTGGKVLHSCETIRTETAKSNNGENWQVNNEKSVHSRNNVKQPIPVIVNCLGYKLGDIDLTKTRRRRKSKKTPQSVTALPKGFVVMEKNAILGSKNAEPSSPTSGDSVNERRGDKPNCMDIGADSSFKPRDHDDLINHSAPVGCKNTKVNSVEVNKTSVGAHQNKYPAAALLTNNKCKVHDGNSNVIDDLALEREDEEIRSQEDCRDSTELQHRIIAANVTQPCSLQNAVVDKVMLYSANMGMLSKENNCKPSEHIEIQNKMEYQSEPPKLLDPVKSIPADSATEENISDVLQNFGKKNPRKRRKLILMYDDDDDNEEDKAVDVQPENASSRPLKYDGLMKHRVDTECYAEPAVLTGDFSNRSPNNGRPVKKQRMGVNRDEDEDEEAVVGATKSDSTLNDVTNCALNDGTNLTSETLVANNPCLQSRMISNSESADHIYPQPADDPVWSGAFKVNSEVCVMMDAHLSKKACQKAREFSKSLQPEPVLEAKKLPWLHVLPKRWKSSGPPDDCIGLFFFPHSFRPNEVSNGLVTEIIESDSALKIAVGIADLLIFPSTILPEQNQLYQGKYYLWGVFKQRKAMSHKGVADREQDGSACAVEECIQQQHNSFNQQYGSACTSEGELQEEHLLNQRYLEQQKSSDQETNVVKHVENQQPLVECNSETQMEAMKISMAEGFTLPGYSLSLAGPNSPIVGSTCSMLSEQANQQEGTTSSPEINAPSAAEPSAEGNYGQSHSVSEPPTTKLFGILVAQTPRARQLFQEMASEGALVFPVQEKTVAEDYTSARDSDGVGPELNPDYRHLLEHSQPFDFVSTGLDESQRSAVACLELFPVQQEHIGWAPGAEASSMGVDLELSLSLPSRPTPELQL
ncbi:unnamed protein product [Urochloa decumbens]|uniref:AIPP2-like SPOC-like domain-containing protein n=1 Tax=Urochloa decumbens TaxID=240449 RepID=A0ABC8W8R6_9POAL